MFIKNIFLNSRNSCNVNKNACQTDVILDYLIILDCTSCPSGESGTLCYVQNNTCFLTFELKTSWYKAEALCRSFNYNLISKIGMKQVKYFKEPKSSWLDQRGEDWVNKSGNSNLFLTSYACIFLMKKAIVVLFIK